jgi:cytosine/adenosine deaminase-related metal-dependent hydrolase
VKSPYYSDLAALVEDQGGYHNAHLHLDRAYTLDDGYVDQGKLRVLESSHISLQKKHALIQPVHEGRAYDADDLQRRMQMAIDHMVSVNTRLADTMIDVTPDRVGLDALTLMQQIARDNADRITVRAAAYTPLGFRDSEPERWRIFEQGAHQAEFIGSLPEADDVLDYPDNIGFEEHCVRMLHLARETGKMLHVHTDQINSAGEDGTERLLAVMAKETGPLSMPNGDPMVWAVHMISPSQYDPARWDRFVDNMKALNVGVISCPSAAIGMRQLRPIQSYTYNSIPRVLELVVAGIPVRLGSDNVADMCSPSTTADLTAEVFTLSAAIRYYKLEILAKLATGQAFTADERALLQDHLDLNDAESAKLVKRFGPKA